jgi:hypothetical protein
MGKNTLSRIGAIISLFALMALPLVSCGNVKLTGADILFKVEERPVMKLLILVALVSAILAVFLVSRTAQIGLGTAGIFAMLGASFMVTSDNSDATQVRGGMLIVLFGFALVMIAGLLRDGTETRKRKT